MKKLMIDLNKYMTNNLPMNAFSYVLINPPHDFQFIDNDIIYVLQPGRSSYLKQVNHHLDK